MANRKRLIEKQKIRKMKQKKRPTEKVIQTNEKIGLYIPLVYIINCMIAQS